MFFVFVMIAMQRILSQYMGKNKETFIKNNIEIFFYVMNAFSYCAVVVINRRRGTLCLLARCVNCLRKCVPKYIRTTSPSYLMEWVCRGILDSNRNAFNICAKFVVFFILSAGLIFWWRWIEEIFFFIYKNVLKEKIWFFLLCLNKNNFI